LQEIHKRESPTTLDNNERKQLLNELEVIISASITTIYSVRFIDNSIQEQKPGVGSHVAKANGRITIYVSQNARKRNFALHRDLPKQLVNCLGLVHPRAYELVTSILHVPLDGLNIMLADEGIISGEAALEEDSLSAPSSDSGNGWASDLEHLSGGESQLCPNSFYDTYPYFCIDDHLSFR